jgi:hypothetical protein
MQLSALMTACTGALAIHAASPVVQPGGPSWQKICTDGRQGYLACSEQENGSAGLAWKFSRKLAKVKYGKLISLGLASM